jgi:hypothetical protein
MYHACAARYIYLLHVRGWLTTLNFDMSFSTETTNYNYNEIVKTYPEACKVESGYELIRGIRENHFIQFPLSMASSIYILLNGF